MADDDTSTTEDTPPNGDGVPAQDQTDTGASGAPGKPDTGEQGKSDGDGEDWKARSRQHEDRAKANRKAADAALAERDKLSSTLDALRKALDPDGSGKDDDPTTVAERAVAERDAVKADARLARVELAAERAARKAGADVDALLDSRAFLARLDRLDPTDDAFAEDVTAAVEATLKDNPRLKATPGAPTSSATVEQTGGGESGTGQLTRAQLKTMSPEDISAARKAGRLKHLLGG